MTAPDALGHPRNDDAEGPSPASVATRADLGRELKAWLRRGPCRGVKVGALAKRLDISQSTLYAYLAGTTLPPTDVLDDLLYAIEVPAADHRRLATARDALERHRRIPDENASPALIPRELPADPTAFTGRTPELERLDTALWASRTGSPSIAVLSGPAGVGKTALAVHWGHRVADRFPGGALYVDLLGFSPGEPRRSGAALAAFLRSLGVADSDIPPDPHERANRLRSRLAGERVLIVLDNALDVDQVRPLLPGDTACFVVVTSRHELDGLHVHPGAHQVPVAPLPAEAGEHLLGAHLSELDAANTASAVRALAARCGGLPLALRVVAAQASLRSEVPLDDLVAELATGLDLFDVGDGATSVRAVFSWSEQRLSREAADTFWLLAAAPTHDGDVNAAAATLGVDIPTTRRQIGELVRAHLVQRSAAGRLSMHDLLREYARERAVDQLSEPSRAAAIDRLLDHLTATAGRAMDLLHPFDSEETPSDAPGIYFADRRHAQAWVDIEWDNLTAAVRFAAESERFERTVRLVGALRRHLDQGGRYLAALSVLGTGRDAARRTGDRVAEATATRDLGAACLRLGRHEEAIAHYRDVLALTREIGDRGGEAGTLNNLGNVHERLGEYTEALDHYHRALPIARHERIEGGEATLLVNLGATYARLGELDAAEDHSRQALAIFERVGDNGGAARSLGNLGDILRSKGEYTEALERLAAGLTRAREIGADAIETEILNALGATRLALGATAAARQCHETALAAARSMGDRFEEARALDGLSEVLDAEDDSAGADSARCGAAAIYRALGLAPQPARS